MKYIFPLIPVFLPGKSYGQRSLAGCSPWGRRESDMTERTHTHNEFLGSKALCWLVIITKGKAPSK